MNKVIEKINEAVASILANTLSSIACFYVVTGLILFALLWQKPHDILGWIQYLIAFLFQGSALPVLGYVSKREGDSNRKMLQETHDMVMSEFEFAKEERAHMKREQADLKHLLKDLHTLQKKLKEVDKEIEAVEDKEGIIHD